LSQEVSFDLTICHRCFFVRLRRRRRRHYLLPLSGVLASEKKDEINTSERIV
jgi:hypothetical protein